MVDSEKKYVANIDFPTIKEAKGHRIHLNPYYSHSAFREKILRHYDPKGNKITRDGGPIYLSIEEAQECNEGKRILHWQGRTAAIFRPCLICVRLSEWDI